MRRSKDMLANMLDNFFRFLLLMDTLQDLVSKRKWRKACLRAIVAQTEFLVTHGTAKVARIYSNVLNKMETEPEIHDAVKEVVPE